MGEYLMLNLTDTRNVIESVIFDVEEEQASGGHLQEAWGALAVQLRRTVEDIDTLTAAYYSEDALAEEVTPRG